MKKLFFATLLLGGSLSTMLNAQTLSRNQVPASVIQSFEKQFGAVKNVEWELDDAHYQAEWKTSLWLESEATFSLNGQFLKSEEELSADALPEAVKTALKSAYTNYTVKEAKRKTLGTDVHYAVEIKAGGQEWEVTLLKDGTIVNKKLD